MAITIRRFDSKRDDTDEIAQLHLEIRRWQETNGQNDFPDIFDSQKDLTDIENFYVLSGGNFFVAYKDTTLVGFIGLKTVADTPKIGELKRLAVHPLHHQSGIASQVSNACVTWARTNNFDHLLLKTNVFENAKTLYEKLQFTTIGFDFDRDDWEMQLSFNSDATQSAEIDPTHLQKLGFSSSKLTTEQISQIEIRRSNHDKQA